MRLLCLSNGHGEDVIALEILQALQKRVGDLEVGALPLVGTGSVYEQSGIPICGAVRRLPSGGFIYMDGSQLLRDLKGGLVSLTCTQWKAIDQWCRSGGVLLAVGDVIPLLFARLSGRPFAFVGTAKSEYYLRDELGLLPRRTWFERLESWSGSVYLPWERWLMQGSMCRGVFPRDRLTSTILQQWPIPIFDLGNPMMDGLAPQGIDFESTGVNQRPLTFVLLPGSRLPEALENWQLILRAIAAVMDRFKDQSLLFLGAIAPGLDPTVFTFPLEATGWHPQSPRKERSGIGIYPFRKGRIKLFLVQNAYGDCLHQADVAIALAGTAVEQFVGLGKPVFTIPGAGPQFTAAFAEAQTRLLGPSVTLVPQPEHLGDALYALLQDPDRLQLIASNGRRRMGPPGAAARIANQLIEIWHLETPSGA